MIARVLADQGFFAPTHLTCFLYYMAFMEGTDPAKKWQSSFWPSYKANLTVWPFVQGLNFTLVPLDYRVLVVNVISLGRLFTCVFAHSWLTLSGWNCILSMINSGDK